MLRACTATVTAVALFVLLGCGGGGEPEAAPADSIVNPALGLQLARVPDGLLVQANDDLGLRLAPGGDGAAGLMVLQLAPEAAGVNLVAAAREHQAAIEAAEGGTYLGAQELVGPLGVAFWSRGRFQLDGDELEETLIFSLDPSGSRMLSLSYRYPAGADSSQRVQQAIEVMGELEALPGA